MVNTSNMTSPDYVFDKYYDGNVKEKDIQKDKRLASFLAKDGKNALFTQLLSGLLGAQLCRWMPNSVNIDPCTFITDEALDLLDESINLCLRRHRSTTSSVRFGERILRVRLNRCVKFVVGHY